MIEHKRGDTFELVVEVTLNDDLVDLTEWEIRSQIRDSSKHLLKELDIEPVNLAEGVFRLTATDAETRLWSPGGYFCDIEFTDEGEFVISTQTFPITITRDVTRTTA